MLEPGKTVYLGVTGSESVLSDPDKVTKDGSAPATIKLEEIKDGMDMDFLNRHEIEGIVKDITNLQWEINIGVD